MATGDCLANGTMSACRSPSNGLSTCRNPLAHPVRRPIIPGWNRSPHPSSASLVATCCGWRIGTRPTTSMRHSRSGSGRSSGNWSVPHVAARSGCTTSPLHCGTPNTSTSSPTMPTCWKDWFSFLGKPVPFLFAALLHESGMDRKPVVALCPEVDDGQTAPCSGIGCLGLIFIIRELSCEPRTKRSEREPGFCLVAAMRS